MPARAVNLQPGREQRGKLKSDWFGQGGVRCHHPRLDGVAVWAGKEKKVKKNEAALPATGSLAE